MATIELIHKRVGNDIQMAVQVLDNGDPISWSEVTALHALLISDSQRVRLGSCTVDGALPQDATTMMLTYSGKSPQYLGVARLVLNFRYRNHQCALDAPVLCFVSSTSEEGVGPVEVYIPADVDPEVNSLQIVVGGGGSASWGTITGNITNQTDLIALLGEKQDTIEDLQDIREGAGAGATAYQKPGSGIPASDMASGVQTSLGKADSAYQKPNTGIPSSDLSIDVQASLTKADSALQSETDPTVPAWAKAANKPSYSYSEISGTPDLSGFITKTVNDLVNYYTKSETYTQAQIDAIVGAIQGFSYESVASLPTASASTVGKIYLVPSADPQTQNVKDEFITIESSGSYSWEQIGSTAIDLSGYVTTSALNTALASYTTTADLTTLLASKQDVIADLATIRSGAALGATAYQKPGTGIPATDLASGVIPDVSAFITKSVNDLTNYYLKSETYTKTEVDAIVGAIQGFSYESVASLPTASASTMGKIYLVPSADAQAQNVKDEFITIESGGSYSWEQIGSTAIDLSGYVTTSALNTALASYTTTADLTTLLAGKQDTIADLATIRSGAALGATAVQPGDLPTVPTISTDIETDKASNAKTASPKAVADYVEDSMIGVSAPTPYDGTIIFTHRNGDTDTVDLNHSHPQYYSKAAESTQPVGGFLPDVVYVLGELSGSVTFALASAVSGDVNHYFWTFETGASAPTVTWPAGITWLDGSAPTPGASKHCEVSILGGVGVYMEA